MILNTGRTVEQFHTRTKTGEIEILNNLAPEAWVEINPEDAKELKVKSGDRIKISSSRGVVEDVVVKVTQTIAEGNIFVPFHFNTQLINTLTQSLFDEKSFEPNFKQSAIQLHSQSVPDGIKLKKPKIAGSLEHQRGKKTLKSLKVKDEKAK